MTAFLMFVMLAVATDTRAVGEAAAIAIGGTVALDAMFGGPVSGASMNPMRSLGPALVSGELHAIWLYIAAPISARRSEGSTSSSAGHLKPSTLRLRIRRSGGEPLPRQLVGGTYERSSVSRRPDHVSVKRQHPAEGASTMDGPGPVLMVRRTGDPTVCVPSIFCILIQSAATLFERFRGTHRILLFLCCAGGEFSARAPREHGADHAASSEDIRRAWLRPEPAAHPHRQDPVVDPRRTRGNVGRPGCLGRRREPRGLPRKGAPRHRGMD